MIDGWFMRKRIYTLKTFYYSGPEIRRYCIKHLGPDDHLYRIFYYDTEPLGKRGHNPITARAINFNNTPVAVAQRSLLESIKRTPGFALRLGNTEWRNNEWLLRPQRLKELLGGQIGVGDLREDDVEPRIEQRGVDIRIGLDIAVIAMKRLADLLILISGDADLVPILKFARREGMQVRLDPLRNPIQSELGEHIDFLQTRV
jgi:uncharacterized LabA/DUF88 family protein